MSETTSQPAPAANQSSSGGTITFNVTYLKSPKGIVKILEIFFLMIAFACAADACRGCSGGRYSYFLFATIVPWILCIVIFIMFLLCLTEMVRINWKMTVMINSAIWAIVLLIAASLWANSIDNSRKLGVKVDGGFYASVVFAFFAIITFVVEIVIYVKF